MKLWPLSIVLVLVGSLEAHAAPAWCSSFHKADTVLEDKALKRDDKDVMFIFPALVSQTCTPDADGKAHAKEMDEARAYWSQHLDLTEADWADVAAWASQQQSSRSDRGIRLKDDRQAWSALSPIGQFVVAHDSYAADALDTKLTELGRFGYIEKCVDDNESGWFVQYAMCRADIDALDRKKLTGELRGDADYSGVDRMNIRLLLADLDAKLKARDALVKQWIAKDDVYKKVFEIAAQARKEWAKVDPALVALTLQMDDARITQSRKAAAGCSDKVWPLFQAAVSKIPAAEFANAQSDPGIKSITRDLVAAIVTHPDGYLASIALLMCETDDSTTLHREIATKIERWPGFRGPRTMAESTIAEAGLVLDDKNAKLSFPGAYHPWKPGTAKPRRDKGRGYGRGVIAKIKPGTDTMHYEFTKASAKQVECTNYKSTNKIIGFDTAGNPTYDGACLSTKTVTLDATFPPFDPDKRYTAGLKVGMVLEPDGDMVAAAWTKNGDKQPSYVFGAAVK